MTRKLLFIINPNAGKKISELIIGLIRKEIPENLNYHIVIWKDKNKFEEIRKILLTEGYTDAIAVGGDGTVNKVAKTILNTGITLGIVPIGSGNGLARTLGLSMDVEKVLKEIALGKTVAIDHGTVNGIPFFCTSGIGFDAHIGNLFATSQKRGLKTYIQITLRELFRYRAKTYLIHINNQIIERKAFLITVANAGQYGNDFFIAPRASIVDGLFHVVIVKPFNIFNASFLFSKALRRKAHLSSSVETIVSNKVLVERKRRDAIHFDGEPAIEKEQVFFENKPKSLNVIVGKKYN